MASLSVLAFAGSLRRGSYNRALLGLETAPGRRRSEASRGA